VFSRSVTCSRAPDRCAGRANQERLDEAGEAEAVRRANLGHYLALAEEAES
jgi:hypothetical protein